VLLFGDEAEGSADLRDPVCPRWDRFHTNTKAGLELAQRILRRHKHNNKQIFHDHRREGLPPLTENGHLYTNSFGLDMKIVNRTLEEAEPLAAVRTSRSRRSCWRPIRWLVNFVEQLSKINRGAGVLFVARSVGRVQSWRTTFGIDGSSCIDGATSPMRIYVGRTLQSDITCSRTRESDLRKNASWRTTSGTAEVRALSGANFAFADEDLRRSDSPVRHHVQSD